MSEHEKTAYHEAGHVLAGLRWLGHTPREVRVYEPRNGKLGHLLLPVGVGPRRDATDAQWRRLRIPEAVMFLSGLAAEEVAGFQRSSGIADLETIRRAHGRGVTNAALVHGLPPMNKVTDDVEGALVAVVEAFPKKKDPLGRLLRIYHFALTFLINSRPALDRLATGLAARRSLTTEEIEAAVSADLRVRRPAA